MIYELFAVRDNAVEAFLPPFHVRSRGEALRSFSEAVNKGDHQFSNHPDDYVLYHLGKFDDASGVIAAVEPTRIVSAREALVPSDPFTPEANVGRGGNGRIRM